MLVERHLKNAGKLRLADVDPFLLVDARYLIGKVHVSPSELLAKEVAADGIEVAGHRDRAFGGSG